MHENRLYIAQATVPKNAPAANWFQISIQFLDEQYKPVRYSYAGLHDLLERISETADGGPGRAGPAGRAGCARPGSASPMSAVVPIMF